MFFFHFNIITINCQDNVWKIGAYFQKDVLKCNSQYEEKDLLDQLTYKSVDDRLRGIQSIWNMFQYSLVWHQMKLRNPYSDILWSSLSFSGNVSIWTCNLLTNGDNDFLSGTKCVFILSIEIAMKRRILSSISFNQIICSLVHFFVNI